MSKFSQEELLTKHKKERKDLLAQIQSLKKSCSKGDKKKKKEILEQIAKIEQELDEQQEQEFEELKNESADPFFVKNILAEVNCEFEGSEETVGKQTRISKAQKRRNKKAAEDKKRNERIRIQDEENKKGPRLIETDKINETLKSLGMKIYSVPADGNCLYGAINHQLKITEREEIGISELRKLTAKYMREHKDDILPFMSHDEDEVYTEEQYEKYCNKVANTTEWGGQIEILALSNALKCPIKVIQATSSPTIQGEHFQGPPLVLSYHRHLYRLGEHYNSTIPI